MHFQDIITRLNDFWRSEDCALLQPYDLMMGAATFHPATSLRVLGKHPWRAAYVQACRRPADGRYGENPHRLQHYYQYQTIMKPSPANIRENYLKSLAALGIEAEKHDILFLEDDWESPTLGAWGLGWEVRCDGMEISQFTYFQQMGGLDCHPVAAEITYGLERLALFLQDKSSVFDLTWNDHLTYGELFKQNEYEGSIYNFQRSDHDTLFAHFNHKESLCKQLLDGNKDDILLMPAWECCIEASHIFNLLDAKGVIGVSERQHYIGRIRHLARHVATEWHKRQEHHD